MKEDFEKFYKFYHNFSHASLYGISHLINRSNKTSNTASFFDNTKMSFYKKEIDDKIAMAKLITITLFIININLQK